MLTHLVTVFKNGKIKYGFVSIEKKSELTLQIANTHYLLWALCFTRMIHFILPPTRGDSGGGGEYTTRKYDTLA